MSALLGHASMSASSVTVVGTNFSMRGRHPLYHRAPHASERFRRARLCKAPPGALHVPARDRATGPVALHQSQVDFKLVRQRANSGHHLGAAQSRRGFRQA